MKLLDWLLYSGCSLAGCKGRMKSKKVPVDVAHPRGYELVCTECGYKI